MTDARSYAKIVEWSEEDGVFIGRCPGIIGPCCHDVDEREVYRRLCDIVDDWLAIFAADGRTPPAPTLGRVQVVPAATDRTAAAAG